MGLRSLGQIDRHCMNRLNSAWTLDAAQIPLAGRSKTLAAAELAAQGLPEKAPNMPGRYERVALPGRAELARED